MMVKKHNKLRMTALVFIVLILMGSIFFLVGKSFGFFQYMKKGDVINVVTISGIDIEIDNTTDNALNLTNAYPVYDSEGLNTDPFVFTIVNSTKKNLDYTLKLVNDEDKQALCFMDSEETIPCTLLPYQYIKYSYSLNDGAYSEPANLSEDGNIYSDIISSGGRTKIAIKLWIDSAAPNSIQGNTFFGKLVITGEKSKILAPGLYDSNDNMLKSWTELETLGLTKESIERDYDGDGGSEGGTIFYNNELSGKLVLPNTITKIGDYYFQGLDLTEIVIPDSVTSIGTGTFQSCQLTAVTFGKNSSLTSIGPDAFNSNKQLTSITFPASLNFIGTLAFENCSNLTSVTFLNPNGWIVKSDEHSLEQIEPVNLSSSDLSDVSISATYLTDTYCGLLEWTRAD